MQKRSQVQSQVFIYLLILIVIGATILFGYDSLSKLTKQGKDTQTEQFKTQLRNDITGIAPNFGSVKLKSYSIPGITKVCFGDATGTKICDVHPLAQSAISGGSGNVFLIKPDGFDAFKVDLISVSGGCQLKCFYTPGGRLSIKITGQGDKAIIENS